VGEKANDAMYSMTCDREEGCDLVLGMDCALGCCLEHPELKLARYESSTNENDPTKYISWNQFETQYKCKRHGYIDSGKCPQCQALPIEQQPEKKPMSTSNTGILCTWGDISLLLQKRFAKSSATTK
jgi:hypothetical protein